MNPFKPILTRSPALLTEPLLIYSSSSCSLFNNTVDHDYAIGVQCNPKFIALREWNYYQMLTVGLVFSFDYRMNVRLLCHTLLSIRPNILQTFSYLKCVQIQFGILYCQNFVSTLLRCIIYVQRNIIVILIQKLMQEFITFVIPRQAF